MRRKSTWLLYLAVAILSAGCAEPECRGSNVRYYDEALAFQLTKRNVSYKTSQGVVCVGGFSAADMRSAQADVDAVFNQVNRPLKDECEERAFTEWAKKEGLRFDVLPYRDPQNQPAGRMFLLRSFTPEEVASNKAKLEGAPKGATCKPEAKKR
jgi:hypothetical protein